MSPTGHECPYYIPRSPICHLGQCLALCIQTGQSYHNIHQVGILNDTTTCIRWVEISQTFACSHISKICFSMLKFFFFLPSSAMVLQPFQLSVGQEEEWIKLVIQSEKKTVACPLCPHTKFQPTWPTKLEKHLRLSHVKHAVDHAGTCCCSHSLLC